MVFSSRTPQDRVDGAVCRRRAGFTLTELLIVVAMMGTVLAIIGPRITRTMLAAHVRSASVDLTARLALARQTAIKRNTGAVFHVASGKAWVSADVSGGTLLIGDTLSLDDRYGVSVTASIDTVRYNARGFAALGSSQTFDVAKSGASTQTVCVTAAGLILSQGCTL